jgi:NACHT domain
VPYRELPSPKRGRLQSRRAEDGGLSDLLRRARVRLGHRALPLCAGTLRRPRRRARGRDGCHTLLQHHQRDPVAECAAGHLWRGSRFTRSCRATLVLVVIDLPVVQADLAAFADDDEEVIVDRRGQAIFARGGEEVTFTLTASPSGDLIVELDGERMPYRKFLSHHLGRLDVLAERILTKRARVPAFVDGQASLQSLSLGERGGKAVGLLREECVNPPPFASRVVFITADAGQGKTALLRQFQADQAEEFLRGKASFVFWHVDLQGRQLLRLSEALMGDLGDLRVPGLWMPAIVRLLRHRVLVLAIDGFDELAAEQGSTDALGALALLVQQMEDQGTIVAASRRTFFDTDDYLRRAGLFARAAADCEFDQLLLHEWRPPEAKRYLHLVKQDDVRFDDPDAVYSDMLGELGDAHHPMLTRPFLLSQVTRALLRYNLPASEFIRGMDDPLKGVGAVIERFVEREVSEKWKQHETGEPYLTKDQHLRLLADVAEEMFRSQKSRLDLDVIETITTLLLDEWDVERVRRQQVLDMVRMHVLLTPPPDGDMRYRSFDHPEFRDWFTAFALKDQLDRLVEEPTATDIANLLSVAQMTDATARYACALLKREPARVRAILKRLNDLIVQEWRPTYLQLNVGTFVPFLIDGIDWDEPLDVALGVIYSSLIFEGSILRRVRIANGTFINASFAEADWQGVDFFNCDMGEPTFDRRAKYVHVQFRDCKFDAIRVIGEDDEELREYAPARIRAALASLGIAVQAPERGFTGTLTVEPPSEGETRKLVNRVLRTFRRTTVLPETLVDTRFGRSAARVKDEVLPLMERHDVIEERPWRGSGNQRAWALTRSVDEIQRGDGDPRQTFGEFWADIDSIDAGSPGRS